ncbi:MAG: RdgB/HAM1 family non-canonical purine NTP pyrophosphatase [Flavobacteriales bacterium]|nr:RdgB/HAM1 family non-canonical purine NTP pyrophosphatase [Flavobacteriales bacterium]
MRLIFATHNQNKLREVEKKLGRHFELDSLTDIGWKDEIPETADTIKGNAVLKARAVFESKGLPCFADDTGLEIDSLEGRPGVYSARYAGEDKNAEANMDKVLSEMFSADNRAARFITCIALIISGEAFVFEGVVEGQITHERRGVDGFGYDPIFLPNGYDRTFAEMTLDEKNLISHRAIATDKLIRFLYKLL